MLGSFETADVVVVLKDLGMEITLYADYSASNGDASSPQTKTSEKGLSSSPDAEKLKLIDHFFGRSDGDELKQSTHLFTNGIRLLLREDHPSVGLALCKTVAVQMKEVPDVEALQHTAVRSSPFQLLQIGRAEHLRFTCSCHIQPAVPKRLY